MAEEGVAFVSVAAEERPLRDLVEEQWFHPDYIKGRSLEVTIDDILKSESGLVLKFVGHAPWFSLGRRDNRIAFDAIFPTAKDCIGKKITIVKGIEFRREVLLIARPEVGAAAKATRRRKSTP